MLRMFPLESRMLSTPFRWSFNLCLCLVILASAQIGQVIGLQGLPLAISVIWPATGFSLAAIMLFGFKAWPGIFLGNLLYNVGHLYLGNPHLTAVVAGFVITCGSLIQACVGGMFCVGSRVLTTLVVCETWLSSYCREDCSLA